MSEALRFFSDYEAVIYFILGLGAIAYLWRFWTAWQEVRGAQFGLERESAQQRLNQAAMVLFLMLVMAVTIFVLVTFVAPTMPASALLATPTLDLLAEPAAGSTGEAPQLEGTQTLPTATPLPTVAVFEENCVPGGIDITSPASGDTISGEIEIVGSVNVESLGFYKIEVARLQEELWLTIQAGRSLRVEAPLVESWDTSRLPPGEYVLQLLVTDNNGEELAPCRVPIIIAPTSE